MTSLPPPPDPPDPGELFSRSAFASIRGYVYQAWVSVMRWLELEEGARLRFDGHEDIDVLAPSGRSYEQVKDLSVAVGLRERSTRHVLRGFLERYVAELEQEPPPRFVFTTTARPNKTTLGDPELLGWFEERHSFPSKRLEDLRQALDAASDAFKRLDRDDGWGAFADSIWARTSAPASEVLFEEIGRRLEETRRHEDAPVALLAEHLLAEVLRRSSRTDPEKRTVDRGDLEQLCASTREELTAWAESAERRELRQAMARLELSVASLPERLASTLDDHEERVKEARITEVLRSGTLPPSLGELEEIPPSELLRAAHQRVPFESRGELLAELLDWMDRDDSRSVRLIHGPGGQGKSRLAIELIRRSKEWLAGFVATDATEDDPHKLGRGRWPRLLVVDYANEDPVRVKDLLRVFNGRYEADKVRILLLGRHATWLDTLRPRGEERSYFESIEHRELEPLYADPETRVQALESTFAAYTGVDRAEARRILGDGGAELPSQPLERALYLHILALLAALSWRKRESIEGLPRSRAELLQAVLEKETNDHWQRALQHRGVVDRDMDDALREAQLIYAAATAMGGLTESGLDSIPWDRLGASRFRREVLDALSRFYAGRGWGPETTIPKLEPDLLGEHLVWTTLSPDQFIAIARALEPVARFPMLQLLARVPAHEGFHSREEEPRSWSLQVLREGLDTWREAGVVSGSGEPTSSAFDSSEPAPEHADVVLGDTLLAQVFESAADVQLAEAVLRELPDEHHALLDTQRACLEVQLRASEPEDPAHVAGLCNSLGVIYSRLGGRESALLHAERAVALYRELASTRPEAFRPVLATSLNNLSNYLSNLGRREEALAAIEEAVALYRELAAARPEAFGPDLATSLNNLSGGLSNLGRREQALAAIEEAVALRRELAAARPEAFGPDLASSLNNLSADLSELGRREEALAAIEEAVDLLGPHFLRHPPAFAAWMEIMLRNYFERAEQAGREPDMERLLPFVEALQELQGPAEAEDMEMEEDAQDG